MIKHITLFILSLAFATFSFADSLIKINVSNPSETKQLFTNHDLTIHFFDDNMVIASVKQLPNIDYYILDMDAWARDNNYFVAYFDENTANDYANEMARIATVKYTGSNFLFLEVDVENVKKLYPAIHGGLICINNTVASLPGNAIYGGKQFRNDPFVEELIGYVDEARLLSNIQHCEDFGTRDAYEPESVQAQNWIKGLFESYGLQTELMDFSMPGGSASDNVIATLPGTVYPDQYVVLGAHYDSYSYSNMAPGSDDNATGTCGIIEVARILSQYEFKRTIVFCTWSGEEYGLYGSAAYASQAADQGMDILGYFNIDMSGYLAPGSEIHTDIIAPSSAEELVDFYQNVTAIYLPDLETGPGALSGGSSDHASFNNNGYMGIFPFEDGQDYSPYIHTPDDVIGTSVNNMEQVKIFTQATLASVVTMANMLSGPSNLVAIPGDAVVELGWDELVEAESYNIYKNNELLINTNDRTYIDYNVENGTSYTYYITALYEGSGDESIPSNIVTIIPMPPIAFPFYDDFESGAAYWSMEGSWGTSDEQSYSPTHSLTDSPGGDYGNNLNYSTILQSVSLEGATGASLNFYTKYFLESGYDYAYLEISTNGLNWTELDEFNGNQSSWTQESYDLSMYLGEPYVIIRFRLETDVYVTEDGIYIDDLEIVVTGVGYNDLTKSGLLLNVYPNPFTEVTKLDITLNEDTETSVEVFDQNGKLINSIFNDVLLQGKHQFTWDGRSSNGKSVTNGIYYIQVSTLNSIQSHKVILIDR